jgi:hypothetical protein
MKRKKVTPEERDLYNVKFWVYLDEGWPGERVVSYSDTLEGAIKICEKHRGKTRIQEQLERTVRTFNRTIPEPLE